MKPAKELTTTVADKRLLIAVVNPYLFATAENLLMALLWRQGQTLGKAKIFVKMTAHLHYPVARRYASAFLNADDWYTGRRLDTGARR